MGERIPIPPPVPLRKGIKGEEGGCKIARKKHNPLTPPLLRGTKFEIVFIKIFSKN